MPDAKLEALGSRFNPAMVGALLGPVDCYGGGLRMAGVRAGNWRLRNRSPN
ncbi:MAG: hypothetical protein ABI165_12365 [Bryobacteraceae bacterium]